jgi:4-deoxy-L-threo-5-hexosulose-uronate ketol-isomerase
MRTGATTEQRPPAAHMEVRHPTHPDSAKALDTEGLRREFLISGLFARGSVNLVYSHFDRILVGGAVPTSQPLALAADRRQFGSDQLLATREMGVLNLGQEGVVVADGSTHTLGRLEGLYLGRGTKSIEFGSARAESPARFYMVSGLAHRECPTTLIGRGKAKQIMLGSAEESNRRQLNQLIHPDVVQSCNLTMGYTCLERGSVWNTMPCHTHERRMEVYLYFDVPDSAVVFHMMGVPRETRHIVVRNEEGVISPSWSIHTGVGTTAYSFVWAMVGENQTFTDMDAVPMELLR